MQKKPEGKSMGRAKAMMMEEQAQGFYSMKTRVCANCIDEDALREFILQEGETGEPCSYCDASEQNEATVEFNDFVKKILTGIRSEWGNPSDEGVGWEQGWVGDVQDTYDVLTENLEIEFANQSLFNDVVFSLRDNEWCRKNFYELPLHKALLYGWEEFTNVVKYVSRYVFLNRNDSSSEYRGSEEIPPSDFLYTFGEVLSRCNLLSDLATGTPLYRLRTHSKNETLNSAAELGAPPNTVAVISNRMSAAGIAAFYGAFKVETAIAETCSAVTEPTSATVGHFKTIRNLCVADFTKLPEIPSVFVPNSHLMRHSVLFLRDFLRDFTAPIEKDGREHIEYVPTQIVAEYLRFIYRAPDGRPIDGIIYESSRNEGSKACVLFIGPEGTCDPGQEVKSTIAVLESYETFELPTA